MESSATAAESGSSIPSDIAKTDVSFTMAILHSLKNQKIHLDHYSYATGLAPSARS
jgi:hypothetical protein